MTELQMFRGTIGTVASMALAVSLASCDRPQEVAGEEQAPAAKTASETAPEQTSASEQKAPPEKGSDTAAPVDPDTIPKIALVPFAPGGAPPTTTESAFGRKIMNDPDQIAAGKQLYMAMNCVGCHFHGGGGMGPALMDEAWIYGSSIENVAASIREGRPNGMPAFGGHLPSEQIWQLSAYVLSIAPSSQ